MRKCIVGLSDIKKTQEYIIPALLSATDNILVHDPDELLYNKFLDAEKTQIPVLIHSIEDLSKLNASNTYAIFVSKDASKVFNELLPKLPLNTLILMDRFGEIQEPINFNDTNQDIIFTLQSTKQIEAIYPGFMNQFMVSTYSDSYS